MSLFNKEFGDTFGYHKTQRDVCGECKHHKHDGTDWICSTWRSEFYMDYTDYGDTCEEFERRIK